MLRPAPKPSIGPYRTALPSTTFPSFSSTRSAGERSSYPQSTGSGDPVARRSRGGRCARPRTVQSRGGSRPRPAVRQALVLDLPPPHCASSPAPSGGGSGSSRTAATANLPASHGSSSSKGATAPTELKARPQSSVYAGRQIGTRARCGGSCHDPWHRPMLSAWKVPSAQVRSGFSCENTPCGLSHPGTTHACTIQPVTRM